LDESETCFWIPRQEYTSGLINFMKLPVWLLGRVFYWTVGWYIFKLMLTCVHPRTRALHDL